MIIEALKLLVLELMRCWYLLEVVRFPDIYGENQTGVRVKIYGPHARGKGGGAVKVARLRARYLAEERAPNIAYCLSNRPLVTSWAIHALNRRNVKVVLNQNGCFYPAWYRGNFQSRNRKIAVIHKQADYIFWQSNFCRESAKLFVDDDTMRRDGEVLYNAVDISIFRPLGLKRRCSRNFQLLSAGVFSEDCFYRFSTVIEAIKILRQQEGLACDLVIRGIVPQSLKKQIFSKAELEKVKDAIFIHGEYSQSDAPRIFAESDVVLALKNMDPCPNLVIEAMSCGRPVLHTGNGGVAELVNDLSGHNLGLSDDYYNRPEVIDSAKLVRGIMCLRDNHGEYSEGARARSEDMFDIQKWFARHDVVFSSLISGNRN